MKKLAVLLIVSVILSVLTACVDGTEESGITAPAPQGQEERENPAVDTPVVYEDGADDSDNQPAPQDEPPQTNETPPETDGQSLPADPPESAFEQMPQPGEPADYNLNFIEMSPEERAAPLGAPPYWDPDNYMESWGYEKVLDYLNIADLHPGYVPAGLSPLYGGYLYHVYEHGTYGDGNETTLENALWDVPHYADGRIWDYFNGFQIFYADSDTFTFGESSRELTVITDKGRIPRHPHGCIIIPYDAESESNIRGVHVNIRSMGGSLSAAFMYGGNGYHIESAGLTQEEFTDVLLSVIR